MGGMRVQRIRVLFDDDKEEEVRVLNVDLVAFDRERAKHKDWPTFDEGPMFWANYLAWHAMKRTSQIPQWTLTEFEQRAIAIKMIDPDEVDEVDPTQPVAAPE